MRSGFRILALAVSVFVSAPLALAGQSMWQSETTGFHVGGFINGSALMFENSSTTESGGGLGASFGYGLSPLVTLYVEGVGAQIDMAGLNDTYTLAHFDLGARFNFRSKAARWRPFAKAAFTGAAAGLDIGGDLFTLSGAGLSLGGGIAWFFSRNVALDTGLTYSFLSFDEAEFRGTTRSIDMSATSSRFNLGVAWWVGSGR